MSENGIDRSVIQSIATKPEQSRKITDWSRGIEDASITAFSSVHPDSPDWREEIDAIRDAGLKGIKFHPDYQKFYVDDPRIFPIYERIFNCGLMVLFHAGVDIGLKPPYRNTPDRMLKVVKAFRGGRIILAHLGGFRYWDDVEKHLIGEDIWLDTSYTIGWAPDDQVRRIISGHGYNRVLFATDSPWADQIEEIAKLKALKLESEACDAILYKNALTLLGS